MFNKLKNIASSGKTTRKQKRINRNIRNVPMTETKFTPKSFDNGSNIAIPTQNNENNGLLGSLKVVSDEKAPKIEENLIENEDNMAFPFHEEAENIDKNRYHDETKSSKRVLSDKDSKAQSNRRMKMLIAIGLSSIWFGAAIGYYAKSYAELGSALSLPPHIMGVYIAGLFAPVYLLWLALGLTGRQGRRNNVAQAEPAMMYEGFMDPLDFPSRETLYLFHKDIELFSARAAELSAYSKAMAQTIPEARERLKEDVRLFLEFSDQTSVSVDNLSKLLEERSARFLEVIEEIEDRANHVNNEMHEGIKESYMSAKELSDQIEVIATDIINIQTVSQELHVDVQKSNKELTSEAERMAEMALKASRVIQQASGSFSQQSNNMMEAMNSVNDYRSNSQLNNNDRFEPSFRDELRSTPVRSEFRDDSSRLSSFSSDVSKPKATPSLSQYSIDGLHALTVDLARSIDGQVRESIWELYQNGDREAFTQYLLTHEDKVLSSKTYKTFKSSPDFRGYVSRYIEQFETLYEELYEESDNKNKGDLFPSLILNSNLGRLYKVLCRLSGHPAL